MQIKADFFVGTDFAPDPTEEIMPSLFQEYERVMVESLITSFGLDFLVRDHYGGDVDTILNVRKIGQDPQMKYKSKRNEKEYQDKKEYLSSDYHKGTNYQSIKAKARRAYSESGTLVRDAYTGDDLIPAGRGKGDAAKFTAELDHVIAAKAIHEDRGRVLAGLSGVFLANSEENLQFTNKSLNASMGKQEIPEYVKTHPELSPEVKKNMTHYHEKAKSSYEAKLSIYYNSFEFIFDSTIASLNVGLRMSARQVCGFIFAEMWFSVKEEFQQADKEDDFDLSIFLKRIGNGLKRGWERAMENHKALVDHALSGAVAGFMSSITTTLCNIFFTTAEHTARIIRQSYASLVEAAKVLFINPECYTFGERMQAVAKILATGASVVTGTMVSELVGSTAIGTLPVLGKAIQSFCGAFIGGVMSCTFLYLFDRSELIKKLVKTLDNIHTIETDVQYFRQQADYFECYAAELMEIDLTKFQEEVALYWKILAQIESAETLESLNSVLRRAYQAINTTIPWQGYDSFDNFMQDKNAHLVFE